MFVKFSNCSIIGTSFGTTGRVAARKALGSFEYDDRGDGFLYVSVRACTADVPNLNFDMLPHEELKTAYRTFVGKPVYVNHSNTNLDRARGYIIDAVYHDEDPEDRWIEILMEMDEVTFPRLCALIRSGDIDTVSMGLNCETTTCSVCGNVAEQPAQFCNHIKQKGREFDGVLAFEICNGIAFFEESWVYDPADPTATVQALEAEAKTAKVAAKEREFGPDNFYIETEANFAEVEDRPQGAPDYTSESGSEYWYFPDGVIRGSDHWGYGVGRCNWYLDGINRQMYGGELYGYARWSDFENTENYDYIFDKKLNDVVESYVGSGADGTLADHMFGTMQWRHTDMNDEVYDEARTLLRVTAAEKSKSDYAYTPTDNPSDWKLDISDKDHAAAAKAALGKGYRGNKVEIPSDDRQAVIDKVNAACRRFGIEPFGEGKEGSADDASGFANDFIEEYDSLGLSFDSYDELAAEVWSAVEEAADADEEFYADALQEIAGHYKLADNMVNKLRIPEEVDMQNSDRVCPICGSPDFDGIYCDVCEYVEYAEGFGDIDTEEAQENKELRKDLDDAEEPDAEVTEDAEEEYAEDTDDARVAARLFDVPDDQGTVLAALADAGYAEGIDYDLASGGKIASYSASLDELMRGGVIGKESRWL